MQDQRPETPVFKPVVSSRVSHDIVDQIKLLIRSGKLIPGDRLPSERELCDMFGVSRVTVREALRVLEGGGLLAIKVGSRGGAFVTRPSAGQLGDGLADMITLSPLTATEATEARSIFEVGILPLVVERATAEDIEALLSLVEQSEIALRSGTYTVTMSAAFHIRLAECTHNPAIEMIMASFHGPLLMSLREAKVSAPLMGPRGIEEHRQLAMAIRNHDLALTTAIMTEHIERTAGRVARDARSDTA